MEVKHTPGDVLRVCLSALHGVKLSITPSYFPDCFHDTLRATVLVCGIRSSIKRRRLGAALRRLREQSARNIDDAAKNLGWSKSKVGDPTVMRDQLAHRATMLDLPNIIIQVLPFSAGAHPSMNGPFTVLEFSDPEDPHIVYLDVLTTSYYLDGLREVGAYQLAHERLRTLALKPGESRDMISALVEES